MTKSLPGTIQNTKAPQATMDPDLRRGDAVLVPSNHNPYSSPMTNITHKSGIQTIPPPSYRRRPVSIASHPTPTKKNRSKNSPLGGGQCRGGQKNPSTGGLGQYASPEKWEYAMQYQNPAAQLMDSSPTGTHAAIQPHGMWCRCILHSVRCLHQLPNCHSKSYRSTEH